MASSGSVRIRSKLGLIGVLLLVPVTAWAQNPPPPKPPAPAPPPPAPPVPPPAPPPPAPPAPEKPPEKPPAEVPKEAPKEAPPAPPAEPAKPAEPAPAEPPPAPAGAVDATATPAAKPEASAEVSAPAPAFIDEAPAGGDHWFDAFEISAFVDAYLSVNYNFTKPQEGKNGLVRAYDTANGFSLAWAGLDVSYPAEPVGGTISLRFGPAAQRYNSSCYASNGKCDASYGVEFVKQAYASWRPGGADGAVTLDFGKFDTIYGAEVAESQNNINYTRGLLYWLGQPLFHTGLRVGADLSERLILRGLLVNGWNNTIDNNFGKSVGVQLTYHVPSDAGTDLLSLSLGYLGGPERDDIAEITCPPGTQFDASASNGCTPQAGAPGDTGVVDRDTSNTEGLRHLVDLVLTADPTESLHLVLNGDFGIESVRRQDDLANFETAQWWGVALGARYAFTGAFGLGARGEYYRDDDGLTTGFAPEAIDLVSGTLTLDFLPTDNLIVRLDGRLDWANFKIFDDDLRDKTGSQITTTLGVVATTN